MRRQTREFLAEHPEHTDQLLQELSKKGDPEAWRSHLLVGANGAPRPILANAIAAFRHCHKWRDVVGFNEFSLRVIIRRPTPWSSAVGETWTDADDSRAAEWLQREGIVVTSSIAGEAIQVVAREFGFHPIREYLAALKWDKKPRVETWLMKYAGVADTRFVRAVGPRWLISAIARIMRPGCQVDHVLLLEGPQGVKKSTLLRELAGPDYFTDHLSDLNSKDSRIELLGQWIIEMGELSALKRSGTERLKAFVTARADCFRPPYGRRAIHVPRSCVFAASTNEGTYLNDATGARRFWPVRCGSIDIYALTRDRDQLWAEAYALYQAGAVWWLESDELTQIAGAEQSDRYEPGVWDDAILAWISDPKQGYARDGDKLPIEPFTSVPGEVNITDVLIHGIGKSLDRCTQADRIAVARCLTHYGWERRQRSRVVDGCRPWFYFKPEN